MIDLKKSELKEYSSPFSTAMKDINGPNISSSEIVNIAPGGGQIPGLFSLEPNREAIVFPKDYSTGRNHVNEKIDFPTKPTKYVHFRLKCCDDLGMVNLLLILNIDFMH